MKGGDCVEYRGIILDESVNFYKKDESVFQRVKNSLDRLVDTLDNNGHKILSIYFDEHTKVLIDFNCEHDPHNIKPHNYKHGKGCPRCGHISTSESKSKHIKDSFPSLVNINGHLLLSEYKNDRTKVLIDFNCNHEPHLISPNNYKKGKGCPKCSGNSPKQSKEDLINLLEHNGHVLLSDYNGNNRKVQIDFQCGHMPHSITPNHYKGGSGCPICSESKGEKRIRKWLEENNFTFESQKEFEILLGIGGGFLSYDFYLLEQNILIEYQGEFHDGEVNNFVKENLEYQQEHDKRKVEYAKLNNIILLEIWYWDFEHIEEILQKELIEKVS